MATSGVKVTKSFPPETVAWAYRRGVVMFMRFHQKRTFRTDQPTPYVIAPSNVLRLADRVYRECVRRQQVRSADVREES